jgi:iron complex outermembrane receptor protein
MRSQCSIVKIFLALLILILGASIAIGQTKQILTWQESLASIEKLPAGELEQQQDAVARIRTGVEFWIRLHPNTTIKLEPAPTQPLNSEQILKETKALHEAADAIAEEDKGQAFELGMTVISVTADASPLSPVTSSISHQEIADNHATTVTEVLQFLPGVMVDRKSSRNQAGIMIRGFDTRQVGIYLDNIPLLVPYDGYADISRFLTNDIAYIDVAKGYSSPLQGPNGLGGAVNMVTRQPERRFEGDLSFGRGSGNMVEYGAHVGSRLNKFFFRAGVDGLSTTFSPLSGDFAVNSLQPTYERLNSDQSDVRYSGRIGWTPRENDQYVFSYMRQEAEYGAPPYAGSDTANNSPKYWRWAEWNRDSYYLNTNTGLGKSSSIKFRAFLDFYPNTLDMFDNSNFSTMLQTNSGWSNYKDHSEGFSSDFTTKLIPQQTLSASFFLKGDTHREQGLSATRNSRTGVTTYTLSPWRKNREYVNSIGFQDVIVIAPKMRATVGFSADHIDTTWAQNYDKNTNELLPFTCNEGPENNSFSGCLLHQWTFNPLASLTYSVADSGTLFFNFALKSHFPTMKDRYSSKFGKALANPMLKPEYSRNYTLGYSHNFAFNTSVQLELFRSDMYDAIATAQFVTDTELCPALTAGGVYRCQQSINVGKELHQGVEFSLRTNPIRRLNFNTNYTFLKRTISGTEDMLPVFPTATPKHRTVSTANLQLAREFQIQASARYEAGAFNTVTTRTNQTIIVPASKFATLDLGGIFPIAKNVRFQIGVKNLFDRNYYYQEGFPEVGRNWYFNTRVDF